MSRNWLKNQLLPSKFWFLTVKQATEISNITPTECKDGAITTPYKLTYSRKVDYRNLIPVFEKVYVKI